MIPYGALLFWIGVFAEAEIMMQELAQTTNDFALEPSPLARYIKEHK